MGKRINRTLLNWRWWAIFPLWIALLPVVAVDLALAALVTTGEVADDLRRSMGNELRPLMRWIHNWRDGRPNTRATP